MRSYSRTLAACLGALSLTLVLVGCSSKPKESDDGTVNDKISITGGAQTDANQQPNASGKAGNIMRPHADPAPPGVETGNFAGGLKQ